MSETDTLTSKSQLTLPKAVRQALGVGPGDQVRFVPSPNGFRIVSTKGDITQFRGVFKGRVKQPFRIDGMDRAVAAAASKADARTRSTAG